MTKKESQKLKDLLFSTYDLLILNENDLFKEPSEGFLPSGYSLRRFVFHDISKNKKYLKKLTAEQSGVYIWLGFFKKKPVGSSICTFQPCIYVGCSYTNLYKRITSNPKAHKNPRPIDRFIKINGLSQFVCVVFTIHKKNEPLKLCQKTRSIDSFSVLKTKALIASHLKYYYMVKLKPNLNCRFIYSPPPLLR